MPITLNLTRWATCALVFFLITISGRLPGSPDKASAAEQGYHNVTINSGTKPTTIRVKESVGPRLHGEAPSDGVYNPENMDLSRASSFSNRGFSTAQSSLSKNDTALEARTGSHYKTTRYKGAETDSTSDFSRSFMTSSFANSSHDSDEFQKSFATTSSKVTQVKRSPFSNKTSSFQDQSAVLDAPKSAAMSGTSTLSDKTFSDPEMTHVRRDPYSNGNNLDVARMVDLPSRTLTIKEVRNLINHETIPNLNEKADDDLKELNDPQYEPPAPLRDYRPQPVPAEEKDGGLPSPGTIASPTPASTDPLPK